MLTIITDPTDATLTSTATPYAVVDDQVRILAASMIAAMQEAGNAAGLAAPQVGISKRLIICQWGKDPIAMVNPRIVQSSAARKIDEEGCLSLPDQWLMVERATQITVEFLDLQGEEQSLSLNDFSARVVQHEIDHLNGVLMTDRNKQLPHGQAL